MKKVIKIKKDKNAIIGDGCIFLIASNNSSLFSNSSNRIRRRAMR